MHFSVIAILSLASGAFGAHAGALATARVTIYPGDTIRADEIGALETTGSSLDDFLAPEDVVGKTAVRTLVPGQPVRAGWVQVGSAVRIGAPVRLVFRSGGLTIATVGIALQKGGLGQSIRVRNNQSGLVVSGIVSADGTVEVGAP